MAKRTSEQREVIEHGHDLIQMYQAGYRDAWRKLKSGRLNLKELNLNCSEAFAKRFKTKLGVKIRKNDNTRQKAKS